MLEFRYEVLFAGAGVRSGWVVGGVVGALLLCWTLLPDAGFIFVSSTALYDGNRL